MQKSFNDRISTHMLIDGGIKRTAIKKLPRVSLLTSLKSFRCQARTVTKLARRIHKLT